MSMVASTSSSKCSHKVLRCRCCSQARLCSALHGLDPAHDQGLHTQGLIT